MWSKTLNENKPFLLAFNSGVVPFFHALWCAGGRKPFGYTCCCGAAACCGAAGVLWRLFGTRGLLATPAKFIFTITYLCDSVGQGSEVVVTLRGSPEACYTRLREVELDTLSVLGSVGVNVCCYL